MYLDVPFDMAFTYHSLEHPWFVGMQIWALPCSKPTCLVNLASEIATI